MTRSGEGKGTLLECQIKDGKAEIDEITRTLRAIRNNGRPWQNGDFYG
jgi:hypothetical protein